MRAVLLAVLATAVAMPSAAEAATVRVNATSGASNRTLTVTLEGATRVSVGRNASNLYVVAYAGDTLTQTGSACSAVDGGLDCGTESSFGRVVVNGSSGADEIVVAPQVTRASTLNGNGGDDQIAGGGGNDTIDGHNGNDVITGGAGNDDLNGSAGNDFISGDTGNDVIDGGTGRDVLSGGGQGGDALDYANRSGAVTVDLNRVRPQGEAGENDEVDGFAVVLGGSGADTLIGTGAAERLEGNGGADSIVGGGGSDTLNGGAGEDAIDARDGMADAAIACGAARDRLAKDAADPTPADCEIVAPLVTGTIGVAGEARIGGTLSAVFTGSVGGTESALAWRWLRCGGTGCVAAGDGATYAVTEADIGAQLYAVLRADNEAGAGELASGPLGPVPAPVAATPPPAPPAVTPGTAVRSVRCAGRRCRVALTMTGAPTSVRAVLTRGGRRIASTTRKTPRGRLTLTLKAKRALKSGRYRLRITAPGAKTVTRTVRVKR